MSYLGNSASLEIFPANTREELVAGQGIGGSSSLFLLKQEVPGGYPQNILLVVNNVIQDPEEGSYSISGIDGNFNRELNLCEDIQATDRVYIVHRGDSTFNLVPSPGSVEPESLAVNLRNFTLDRFTSTGVAGEEFTLAQEAINSKALLVTRNGTVLDNDDPSVGVTTGEYRIVSQISLFVQTPTPGAYTVGETILGLTSGATARFVSQSTNELVCIEIDGTFEKGEDVQGQTSLVTETLLDEPNTNSFIAIGPREILQILPAFTPGDEIRALHLGFSTISKKSVLGNFTIPPNSVGTLELQSASVTETELATDSVVTTKIKDDNVLSNHVRFENDTALRINTYNGGLPGGAPVDVINLDASDNTIISNPKRILLDLDGAARFEFQDDGVDKYFRPLEHDTYDLGRVDKRWRVGYFQTGIEVAGDILVEGLVDGVDISTLEERIDDVENAVENARYVGEIIMWPSPVPPSSDWLYCDGEEYSVGLYPELNFLITTTFGGIPSTTFKVPDFRQRVPVGVGNIGPLPQPGAPALAAAGGNWDHFHQIPDHIHTLTGSGTLPIHVHEMVGGTSTMVITHQHKHNIAGHTHDHVHNHKVKGHWHDTQAAGADIQIVASGEHVHQIPTVRTDLDSFLTVKGDGDVVLCGPSLTQRPDLATIFLNRRTETQPTFFDTGPSHTHSNANFLGRVGLVDAPGVSGDVDQLTAPLLPGEEVTSTAETDGSLPVDGGDVHTAELSPIDSECTVTGDSGDPTTTPAIPITGSTAAAISAADTDTKNQKYLGIHFMIKAK